MHRVFMRYHEIHAVGGILLIDSTFGPPPLQYPFKWGADCVFHSGMVVVIQARRDMT
jgi:cystathionine beta-lyase/cystathionine gamma-synthase